ncbi:hypothetical protein VTN96DRAFT_2085 [Rasamsonia emersonii]
MSCDCLQGSDGFAVCHLPCLHGVDAQHEDWDQIGSGGLDERCRTAASLVKIMRMKTTKGTMDMTCPWPISIWYTRMAWL